jgi:hypothetical protein
MIVTHKRMQKGGKKPEKAIEKQKKMLLFIVK